MQGAHEGERRQFSAATRGLLLSLILTCIVSVLQPGEVLYPLPKSTFIIFT